MMKNKILRFLVLAVALGLSLQLQNSSTTTRAEGAASGSPYSAEWRASGPTGGDVRALVVDPSDPNRFYFGTLDGQIYTSTDGARSWRMLVNLNRPQLFVDHIIVDPRNSKVLYVATHRHKEPGGFFKSTDGGLTWRESPELRNQALHSMAQSQSNPDLMLIGTISGVYRSIDSGEKWQKVQGIPSQSRRTRAILQHPTIPGLVFAGTTEGFWRSAKGGENNSWMVTTSRQLEINSITVHPSNPNNIYIGTNNYGVMVSTDGGKNFVPTNGGYSGRFANVIVADRETPNRVYAATINTTTGGGFLFVSTDNGETWRPSMRSMPPRLITYSIMQDTRNVNTIYLGTNLGVYRS